MSDARPTQTSALLPWLVLASAAACGVARAADPTPSEVPALTVIAATPLPGAPIDVAKAPYDVRTLTSADIDMRGLAGAGHAAGAGGLPERRAHQRGVRRRGGLGLDRRSSHRAHRRRGQQSG